MIIFVAKFSENICWG